MRITLLHIGTYILPKEGIGKVTNVARQLKRLSYSTLFR